MRKLVLVCITLMLSFIVMGLAGCGEDSEEDLEGPGKGPSISYMIPRNGAKDVSTTTMFVMTFNREIVTPSAGNLTFTPGVTGTVSYDADNLTLTFKPSSALSKYTDYSMTVTGITDLEGNVMSPATINFSTALADTKRPEITSSYPEDNQKDLGHDTEIMLKFSEPLDRPKLKDGISFDPRIDVSLDNWSFEWGTIDEEKVTMFPPLEVDPFDVNKEYTLKITKGSVVDFSGNSMASDYEVQFHTLRYPVEKSVNPDVKSTIIEPVWMFTVGRRGGTWVIAWGGAPAQGAPAGNSPGGTITASADGQIFDRVETHASRQDEKVTYSVTRGNGNSLTFSSPNLNNMGNLFRITFGSSSAYLTFSLRPATAQYINIGTNLGHPERSTFILSNQ